MTDDDKKNDTLCIFITPSKRVKAQDGVVEYFARDSENYFKKLIAPGPLPLEYAADILNQDGIAAVSGNNVKNVQMIFDIHGDKEGLSISEEEMHKILLPILYALGDKKLEIIMANCQGNLKFKGNNDHESLPEYLKDMAKTYNVIIICGNIEDVKVEHLSLKYAMQNKIPFIRPSFNRTMSRVDKAYEMAKMADLIVLTGDPNCCIAKDFSSVAEELNIPIKLI